MLTSADFERIKKYNQKYEQFISLHPEYRKYNMPKISRYEEALIKTYLKSQRYEWLRAFWKEYLEYCNNHPLINLK